VSDRVDEALRVRFYGRERYLGLFIVSWDYTESARITMDVLNYGGISVQDVIHVTQIDKEWFISHTWDNRR
jgi:hypothetical protein